MILVLDNYDSFTYNLVQYIEEIGGRTVVHRNDVIDVKAALEMKPERVLISPGPGRPEKAGISVELVRGCAEARIPLLGVCLGHQAIAHAFGGAIVHAPTLMHGKTSAIRHDGKAVYAGLPDPFEATRYHSLTVDPALPADLRQTAWTEDGVVMGLRHRELPLEGVQFHPESILTEHGKALLKNFLEMNA